MRIKDIPKFELLRNRLDWKQKRNNFVVYIGFEVKNLLVTLEKLKWNLENKSYYDFLIINRLSQTISNLELSKKDAYYLNNLKIQEDLIDTLSDVTLFLNDVNGLENFASEENKKLKEDSKIPNLIEGNKSLNPELFKESMFQDQKEYIDYFKSRRVEKLVELTDIIRKVKDITKYL